GGRILEYETKTIFMQGVCQSRIHNIDRIMKNIGLPLDEACRAVGSSIEEYQGAKEFLAKQEKTYSGGAG
ncbi:MAG: hypothetical protein LIO67_03390, partial [Lachnospiraceae bacterium]|nr:hypothetical protein [Lachnospiraceae bacterium]